MFSSLISLMLFCNVMAAQEPKPAGTVAPVTGTPIIKSIVYTDPKGSEFMTRWLICGPIPVSAKNMIFQATSNMYLGVGQSRVIVQQTTREVVRNPSTLQQIRVFDFDFLLPQGGETGIQPKEGLKQPFGDKEFQWKFFQIHSKEDSIDLNDYFGGFSNLSQTFGAKEYSVAYAYAEIQMTSAQKVKFGFGSDDSIKVWLNGQLIHERWTSRQLEFDSDKIDAELKAGTNTLLLKIQNGNGDWSFASRIIDPNAPAKSPNSSRTDQNDPNSFDHFVEENPYLFGIIGVVILGFFVIIFLLVIFRRRLDL